MDIYDINLTEITDQYIEYLNAMEEMNLEIASEFLIMASSLLYLKSKKLLPKQEDETEELTEEELIRRIIEYKKYKEITKVFKKLFRFFKKNREKSRRNKVAKKKIRKGICKNKIPEVYSALVGRTNQRLNQNAKNIEKIALVENYTVASKVKRNV